jgi:PilZ domain
MSQKLMDVLTLGHCSHEFSWPRRAPDGHYYQVCVLCASEYRYDWKAMRRTERVEHSPDTVRTSSQPIEGSARKRNWVPRARRLRVHEPLRYRAKFGSAWYEGAIENLSQSGVLFRGAQNLPAQTLVEMIFEMPEEISGQKNSSVLCQGRILRSHEESNDEESYLMAASVLDYKFLRTN